MVKLDLDFLRQPEMANMPQPACTGLIYRAQINNYFHKGTVVHQTRMVKLKRRSCKGCEECGFLEDDLHEFLCSYSNKKTIMPDPVIHDKIYYLQATNFSRDFETGVVDDWDLEFVELKPA